MPITFPLWVYHQTFNQLKTQILTSMYFATFRLVNNTLKFHVKRTPILAPIRLLIAPSACQRRTGVAPDLHNGEGGSKGNVRKKLCDWRPRLELRFGYTQLLTRKQDNAFLQSAPCGMYLFKTIRGETKRKVAHKTKLSNWNWKSIQMRCCNVQDWTIEKYIEVLWF